MDCRERQGKLEVWVIKLSAALGHYHETFGQTLELGNFLSNNPSSKNLLTLFPIPQILRFVSVRFKLRSRWHG